ncbi:hypothetical protein NPX13_g3234 [Xylaria arbuscula]|uniref:Uncharacterized protein n=1 Tax=Xylaria arbuscula TaxID=114810 RepID=A0A9W8TQA7_9PEZI|nr:hypothetical protein NPX13_g3234 [Xylaria arbuscula]
MTDTNSSSSGCCVESTNDLKGLSHLNPDKSGEDCLLYFDFEKYYDKFEGDIAGEQRSVNAQYNVSNDYSSQIASTQKLTTPRGSNRQLAPINDNLFPLPITPDCMSSPQTPPTSIHATPSSVTQVIILYRSTPTSHRKRVPTIVGVQLVPKWLLGVVTAATQLEGRITSETTLDRIDVKRSRPIVTCVHVETLKSTVAKTGHLLSSKTTSIRAVEDEEGDRGKVESSVTPARRISRDAINQGKWAEEE